MLLRLWLFAQTVTIPPSNDPGPFAGLSWVGDTLGGVAWFVVHVVLPGALVVALGLGAFAALTGNKQRMAQSRSAFGGILGAIALTLVAGVFATYLLNHA